MDVQIEHDKEVGIQEDQKGQVSRELFNKMMEAEDVIADMPGARFGDDTAPLEHTFGDGIYIRKITMPKGMILVSKLHKTTHPYFIMTGDVSVLTGAGIKRLKAPFHGITQAGTKRVLYMHEETVWITVHATNETDVDKIEDQIIAKSYDDLPDKLKGGEPCHLAQLEQC